MTKNQLDKKTLVIIEAPGKQGAYKKILGKNATVVPTSGSIRDLPKKKFSVDLKKDFEMTYEYDSSKKEIYDLIKSSSAEVDQIFIATDDDREGEAIGWSVFDLIPVKEQKKVIRITPNAIDSTTIWNSIENSRDLNPEEFQAYETRRALDRIVGFKASYPIKQATGGASAGRVQSPGLRIIAEREKEIQDFIPKVYWPVSATLSTQNKEKFESLIKLPKPLDIKSKEEAENIIDNFNNNDIYVSSYSVTSKKQKPQTPFITSSLQRAASTYLGFSPKKTMSVAQALYQKHHLTTYHRTDSPYIVAEQIENIRSYVSSNLGKKYLPSSPIKYAAKGNAQQAHEACRPTDVSLANFAGGTKDEQKLYRLIWERTISSQMNPAEIESISAEFSTKKEKKQILSANGRRVVFDGYQKIITFGGTSDQLLPQMKEGEKVKLENIKTEKKETKPPQRYSEAALVGILEKKGIGRPSTYASIVETIKDRGYVVIENKSFRATELGMRVCDFMVNDVGFSFIDYDFTSDMESRLDKIAEGKLDKVSVLNKAWTALQLDIEKAKKFKENNEKTDFKCPKCKGGLLHKNSKFGPFFTCENYNKKEPEKCEYKADVGEDGTPKEKVKKEIELSDYDCPKCGEKMAKRKGKYGEFFGCSQYFKTKCNGMRDANGIIVESKKKSKKKWKKKKKKP